MEILKVLLWILVIFLSSFALWRRIKEDYPEEQTMRLIGLATVTALLGSKLFGVALAWTSNNFVYSPAIFSNYLELYGAILGGYLIGMYVHWDSKRWWGDYLDGLMEAILWAVAGVGLIRMLSVGFSSNYVGTYVAVSLSILGLVLVYFARSHYRKFYWYKSGKVGFVFWALLSCIGLGRLTLLYWESSSMTGYALLAMNLIVLSLGAVGLYRLSGRNWNKDFDLWFQTVQNMPVRLNQSKRKWTHK